MLEIKRQIIGDVVIISPQGRIDPLTCEEFDRELHHHISQGNVKIILDCSSLEYISSAGLGAIIAHLEETREKGGDIFICCTNSKVYEIFDLLGFTKIFKFYKGKQEALQEFINAKD